MVRIGTLLFYRRLTTHDSRLTTHFLSNPHSGITKHSRPRSIFAPMARVPGILHGAIDAFGMRHQRRDPSVAVRDRSDALGRTIRIGRIAHGRCAAIVYEARTDELVLHADVKIPGAGKFSSTLT